MCSIKLAEPEPINLSCKCEWWESLLKRCWCTGSGPGPLFQPDSSFTGIVDLNSTTMAKSHTAIQDSGKIYLKSIMIMKGCPFIKWAHTNKYILKHIVYAAALLEYAVGQYFVHFIATEWKMWNICKNVRTLLNYSVRKKLDFNNKMYILIQWLYSFLKQGYLILDFLPKCNLENVEFIEYRVSNVF